MLKNWRSITFAIIVIVLMLIYGATSILIYGALVGGRPGESGMPISASEIGISFMVAASFMVLSGYIFTAFALYVFIGFRKSWLIRAPLNLFLLGMHVGFFAYVVGNSFLHDSDFVLILAGAAAVLMADATAGLLWRRISPPT